MPFAIDIDALTKVVSPLLVALISGLLKHYFEARPKLITYLVHSASHPLPVAIPDPESPGQPGAPAVHTHTIVVRNAGKKSAHNVRIDHAVFPLSYRVMPPVNHTVTRGQGDSAEICIPVLVPNEQVTVSYLYFPPLTWDQVNGWVKSDEGMARAIYVIPSIPPPRPVMWLLWALTFVGASTVMYWALRLLPGYLS